MFAGEYFTEEVRREIIARYGEDALYEGGLSVRTTLDPADAARRRARRFITASSATTRCAASAARSPRSRSAATGAWRSARCRRWRDVPEWRPAVVLETGGERSLTVGLQPRAPGLRRARRRARDSDASRSTTWNWALRHTVDGQRGAGQFAGEVLSPGDVVYRREQQGADGGYRAAPGRRRFPAAWSRWTRITGRVLAMVGGFSFAQSEFNRATQAMRQPGSSFKPILYAAALDNGYTPASVVDDAPITIRVGNEVWEPKNYGGRLRRTVDAAHGHRALAQPDDGAACQRHGHGYRRRICRALRRLRQDAAGACHVAGFGRDDGHAHGLGLFGDGEWRRTSSLRCRPHPGPLRQDRLQARPARLRGLQCGFLGRAAGAAN